MGGLELAVAVIVRAYGLWAHRRVYKHGSYGYNAQYGLLCLSSNTGTIRAKLSCSVQGVQ